ncbi:uncharacterized protein GIQ15_02242 [Arthroderma uncinatum]|uniref:uncharacterized protein n=1 Tax=Arthroderma uncinatum TaxID=74035 RepID=UPI00144A9F6E|nr:uncharacterized protein GIQ15_02242 [Arthroderma uncinatum]KAF3482918.1 hypothetical protein GIQ15_02242 [Arthroderma uncinatum]
MEPFEYNASPARVIFGTGTIKNIPDEIIRLGVTAPLLLSTPRQAKLVDDVKNMLQGKVAGAFNDAVMHIPTHITEKALAYAQEQDADSIISIGGGSVIGLGKAISFRTGLPHICIPTTYSGSEMTPILGETVNGVKNTKTDPKILPGTVIYDVDLTMSLPASLSATSGVNAIAHAVEALYARNGNPIVKLLAREGIKSLSTALPEIVANPHSEAARSAALYGAWLCGLCLGSVGMALHHKLCHALGGSFNLPHAETHTAVLPHAIAYNSPNIPDTMATLAEVLPGSEGDAIRGLNVLLAKLQVKRGAKEFGMKEEDIDQAAEIAVRNAYWNPREVQKKPIRELIRREQGNAKNKYIKEGKLAAAGEMAEDLKAAPVLSTPDSRILDETEPTANNRSIGQNLSDEEFRITYDIERTIREIKQGKWQRIALQFPDDMLPDAPRVFQLLSRGLNPQTAGNNSGTTKHTTNGHDGDDKGVEEVVDSINKELNLDEKADCPAPKLYILADTSYGTCCVDEVAAEHVDADVVVHYGRSCLSPTARLPVVYIFTCRPLDHDAVVRAFEESYPNREERITIVADVTYAAHVDAIASILTKRKGYTNVFATQVVHNPSSPIPNRTIPPSVESDNESLHEWQLFHISDPPTSLLLTLSSRVAAIRIFPTDQGTSSGPASGSKALLTSTTTSLRRRYAILTRLNTEPIFGILVNTLSVKNYLHIVQHVQKLIAAAGKKSYLFVVGKLNVAKIANFSEIGGWVIIGCWESSLVDSRDFWRPVITPYELELALQSDNERVWTGAWSSDYQSLLNSEISASTTNADIETETAAADQGEGEGEDEAFSEPESAPPDFDLRTGRYVSTSNTRPMQALPHAADSGPSNEQVASGSKSLAKRFNTDVATIGGVVSPGAEFLKSNRSWKGLGSDFVVEYEEDSSQDGGPKGSAVVEGLAGIARGYRIGDNQERR